MGMISKAKKAADALRNINVILALMQDISRKQDDILQSQVLALDNAVLARHKKLFGTYISSDMPKLQSSVCRMQDMLDYDVWSKEMGKNLEQSQSPGCILQRKGWEFIFIAQALSERGMLQKGKKGLGFAVGKEPLPSLFAKYGCEIVATDLDLETAEGKKWAMSNQHGDSLNDLYRDDICDKDGFFNNVTFEYLDMNDIPPEAIGFDFCWSACAFEHLGSIQKGKQFIYNMLDCLKPGGFAVHTTEYNISSLNGALDNTGSVIFGRSDFEEMRRTLISQGHTVEELDFRLGDYNEEDYVAYPPYTLPHFKLNLGGYISTSFALIIQKAQ